MRPQHVEMVVLLLAIVAVGQTAAANPWAPKRTELEWVHDRFVTVHNHRLTFDNAVAYCEAAGLQIVTPTTKEFYDALMAWDYLDTAPFRSRNIWIGLTNHGSSSAADYYWKDSDSTPLGESGWTNWDAGQPTSDTRFSRCVAARHATSGWRSYRCTTKKVWVVCQTAPNVCPEKFAPFGGKCYSYNSDRLTYTQATAACGTLGAKLAEPKTQDESDAIKTAITRDTWIGMNDLDTEGTFVTASDNQAVVFTDFYSGEPNNWGGNEHCVEATVGGWNDDQCDVTNPYICQEL